MISTTNCPGSTQGKSDGADDIYGTHQRHTDFSMPSVVLSAAGCLSTVFLVEFLFAAPRSMSEMGFVSSIHQVSGPTPCRLPSKNRRRRACRHVSPRLSLSSPNRNGKTSLFDFPSAPSVPIPLPISTDFSDWSSDFLRLCNEQLSLLMTTIPNLEQVALLFRHENPGDGALEFVPLIVHSTHGDDQPSRVWISAGAVGTTAVEEESSSRTLPGSIPASWILPDYPFANVPENGGIPLPDGGLCVPVLYNDVMAGTIILNPKSNEVIWSADDVKRTDMVAKSIALAAALEGKWQADKNLLRISQNLIDSVRVLLQTTLHQVRSPVQALVIFGQLLLRKLPLNDENRSVAKNIVVSALRVDELLQPLDHAQDKLVLPAPFTNTENSSSSTDGPIETQQNEDDHGERDNDFEREPEPSTFQSSSMAPASGEANTTGLQLLWLSDVLQPQVEITETLAAEHGMSFVADIEDDTPPVMAVDKYIREAVSNLFDNSLNYAPKGSVIGISSWLEDSSEARHRVTDEGRIREEKVVLAVWDTGYGFSAEEQEQVWDFGYRGSAAWKTDAKGSGLGLGIVRELLTACNASISLVSPLPPSLDPRGSNGDGKEGSDEAGNELNETPNKRFPGAAFIIVFQRGKR